MIAGLNCNGGNLDAGETASRTLDNIALEGTMMKLEFKVPCASGQLAISKLKMCMASGDAECGP